MLELVAQSVKQRGSGDPRTGAHDLLDGFQLRMFFNLSMKNVDRNYISISTKEVPTGLPGDTSLFAESTSEFSLSTGRCLTERAATELLLSRGGGLMCVGGGMAAEAGLSAVVACVAWGVAELEAWAKQSWRRQLGLSITVSRE
ncbi:hypothetical protein VOLCADRAFT_87167 [Volvox carteri f. nagariensis]|uniref:Uncharacterized protein n=1 Tax=Volvox carteri f. nagariensis TaxID=3068 RepID=D8TKC7_VOLCA|nr:uncharacterized protein VOLCADRAFT_87167 [Volvox carteri f. nagariensis]EFJ52226.1 hypothetical protein VOLCADRAFT_87167 [Volvox carteri f. nagariensis]|eukprot:XP_002947000.1 hypothetical protein VOLCADRAFT_87167 [Volvox carteri f. nagariensis]